MWKQYSKKNSEHKFTSAQQVYDCALNLLSYHDYSEQKISERLRQKGADTQQISSVISKLKNYGLLDERRYAFRVYENWLNKRYYGRMHLQAELNKHGIETQYITEILAEFTENEEIKQAENAAELFLLRNKKKIAEQEMGDKRIYSTAARFMAARGFSSRYMNILLKKLQGKDEI